MAMILNIELAPRLRVASASPTNSTAAPQTGFLVVPNIDDLQVLLLLDFGFEDVDHAASSSPSSRVRNPWRDLCQAGYPCLLAVPALPLKTPPASPQWPQQTSEKATADGDDHDDDNDGARRAGALAAVSEETPLYMCLRETTTPTAEATLTERERWFQLVPPQPSLMTDLHKLCRAALRPRGAGSTQRDGVHAVCRDIWPLPPISVSASPSVDGVTRYAPSSPRAGESRPRRASQDFISDNDGDEDEEDDDDDSGSGGAATQNMAAESLESADVEPAWALLSSHLCHLGRWNASLLEYLFRNSARVEELRWTSCGESSSKSDAAPLGTRPSALRLLRLIFRFWHHLLREPALSLDTPSSNSNSYSTTKMSLTSTSGTLRSPKPRRASVTIQVTTSPTVVKDSSTGHRASPLLTTPTQISRAFFQGSLRRHQEQQQQREAVPSTQKSTEAEDTASNPGPHDKLSLFSTAMQLAEPQGEEKEDCPSLISSSPPLLSIANVTGDEPQPMHTLAPTYHTTPVMVVEELLRSIDFSIIYRLSVEEQRLGQEVKMSRSDVQGVVALSATVSFAEAWGSFLVFQMRRAFAAASTQGGEASIHDENTGKSDVEKNSLPRYDLSCTAMDVWAEWALTAAAAALQSTNHKDETPNTVWPSPSPRPAPSQHTLASPTPQDEGQIGTTITTTTAVGAPVAAVNTQEQLVGTAVTSAASPISSPSSSHPCWTSPSPLPKRSASHVSFSVSDVQRPYNTNAAPEAVAAEAAERAAARHRKERMATPPTVLAHTDFPRVFLKEEKQHPSASTHATTPKHPASLLAVAAATKAAQLLHVVPSLHTVSAKVRGAADTQGFQHASAKGMSTTEGINAATATAVATATATQHSAAITPVKATAAAYCSSRTGASRAHSELSSVTHTALPLRSSSVGPEGFVREPGTNHGESRRPSSGMRVSSPPPSQAGQPLSRIESWESSSTEDGTAGKRSMDNGPTHANAQLQSTLPPLPSSTAASGEGQDGAALRPERVPSTTTTFVTNTNFSSSSSMIASEHRLFPLISDDDLGRNNLRRANEPAEESSVVTRGQDPIAVAAAATTPSHCELQKRRGGLYSAASFTSVLSELLTQVLASGGSAPPFFLSPPSTTMSKSISPTLRANDVAVAQHQLEAVHRGRLFPSLATLEALNVLPYYVHVWCYTFDPLTQRTRRLGGEGESGSTGVGGGVSGGGGSGSGSGSGSSGGTSSRFTQTYLHRYEAGTGGVGGEFGRGGCAAATPQQLLRRVMRDGARTLWRGVRDAVARGGSDASAGDGRGVRGDRSHLSQAFTLSASAAATPQANHASSASVYGAGGGGGGRDITKDPTLYNAICGLYITEQDIVIRSMPTEEVRKRRERTRQRQRLQRQQAQAFQHLRRPHSAMDVPGTRAGMRAAAATHAGSTMPVKESDRDDVGGRVDEADEEVEEAEETELLLLPRVGLLSVTACTVSRTAGGVFAEKYAHKLFLHQEDQVVALRAQQQQQRRQHRQTLHTAASSVGLADITSSASSSPALPGSPYALATASNNSGSVDRVPASSGVAAAAGGGRVTPTPMRTHTTLRPFIEDVLQRQQARSIAQAPLPSSSPCGPVADGEGNETRASLPGARTDTRRYGVQRYLASFFRAGASNEHNSERDTSGALVGLLSQENVEAAAAAAPAAAASTTGTACSATAVAFAAAASGMSAFSVSTTQPTLVLKIESKSMPTVWLEFADEATLTYVYHLLEAPLRSPALRSSAAAAPVAGAASPASVPGDNPTWAASATAASSSPEGAPQPPSFPSVMSPSSSSALHTFGNRFLSSARRHWSMVPLVLVAADVLPHGSASSPFMQAFLKNVSVATTMLRLCPTARTALVEVDKQNGEAGERSCTPASTVLSLADTWWLYDPAREFARQGLPPERWSLTRVNENFAFCPTYPSRFVVPAAIGEAMELGELNGQHRLSRRVEAVAFYYAPTGGVLVRSAQPAIARLFVNSATPALEVASMMTGGRLSTAQAAPAASDDAMAATSHSGRSSELLHRHAASPLQRAPNPVAAPPPTCIPLIEVPFLVLNAFAAAAGVSAQQLIVMDLRAVTAAYANMVRGGGTMEMLLYPFGGVEYAGLPNIHDIRKAWLRMRLSLMEAPYKLTGDGGTRRETQFVLRGGEPPYAAVVAAAERCAATSRPATSLAPPTLPSAQRERKAYAPHASAQRPQEARAAGGERTGMASCLDANVAGEMEEEEEQEERMQRAQCLDVVQQAPIAARSGVGRRQSTTAASQEFDREDCGGDGDAAGTRRGQNTNATGGGSSSSGSRAANAASSFFPFARGGGKGRGDDDDDGGVFSSSSSVSMLTSGGAACAAAAAETTSAAQQEWLGYMAGLLNTAVVAARRVCGVPTDPLYVPAMEHNGAMANCFSYVVGHAFKRFWLPVSNANAAQREARRHGSSSSSGGGSGGFLSSSSSRWTQGCHVSPSDMASPSHFDAAVASFTHSAHRSLAQVVFVNCSDGWDRTAQVSILTQLLLDPYYRTVEGLCVLLERELVCFGHPLQKRSTAVRGNLNGGWDVEVDTHMYEKSAGNSSSSKTAAAEDKAIKCDAVQDTRCSSSPTHSSSTREGLASPSQSDGAADVPLPQTKPHIAVAAPASAPEDDDVDVVDEDDLESWLQANDDEAAALNSSSAFGSDATVSGSGEAAETKASTGHDAVQLQQWNHLWRRAVSTVSDGTNALKHQLESGSSSTKGKSTSDGSAGRVHNTPAPSSSAASTSCLREASPIVAQLLDALYQLVRLYPVCFEYTEQFVMLLADLLHCGLVSTFAVNSELQVEQEKVAHGTLSLSQWCALLLSTTTNATSTTATAGGGEASASVSPAHSGGPTHAPSGPHGATTMATVPEVSLATAVSSIDASFQRLDSQFLVNGEADDEEGEEEEVAAVGVRGTPNRGGAAELQMSTLPSFSPALSSTRRSAEEGGPDTPPLPPPPTVSQQPMECAMKAPGMASPPQGRARAHAVYTFDYTTRWLPDPADAPAHLRRKDAAWQARPTASTPHVVGEGADELHHDTFCRRQLPISLDALYTSGYINSEFSLRYNRVVVGPLVDFVLPSRLTLWRAVYARHSFWQRRSAQLQHGVGPVNPLFASARDGHRTDTASNIVGGSEERHFSSIALAQAERSSGASMRGSVAAAMTATAGAAAAGASSSSSPLPRNYSDWRRTGETGEGYGNARSGSAFDGSSRGSLGATPPSDVSPPGMMNFHIGSDSDEEEEEEMREDEEGRR